MSFSDADYDVIDEGCRRSARALVPRLIDWAGLAHGMSVMDVGCGRGRWAEAFQELGLVTAGVDGHADALDFAPYYQIDLAQKGQLGHLQLGADAVVCLEVAEHLPPERAHSFIAELCSIAPIIFFSAAIPNQGGINHLNEQWPSYWAESFWANEFQVTGTYRYPIWDDDRIENWYRQNLLVARYATDNWELGEDPLPLVHPVLWNHRVR